MLPGAGVLDGTGVAGGGVAGGGVLAGPVPVVVPPNPGRFIRLMPPLEMSVVVARVRERPSEPSQTIFKSTLARR